MPRSTAHASVTPFAAGAFERRRSRSPTSTSRRSSTRCRARGWRSTCELAPAEGGFAGAFRATNAAAGPLDAGRLPLTSAQGRFAYTRRAPRAFRLRLRRSTAAAARAATAAIDLARARHAEPLALAIEDLDLARLSTALVATRLSGTLTADVDGGSAGVRAATCAQSGMTVVVRRDVRRRGASRYRACAPKRWAAWPAGRAASRSTLRARSTSRSPRSASIRRASSRFRRARSTGTLKAAARFFPNGKRRRRSRCAREAA